MEKNSSEELKGEIYEDELEKGRYWKLLWGNGKVGIPYLAKISGLDPKYGFKREFVKPVFIDRDSEEYLVDANDLKIGALYERKNPSSWKHPDIRTFLIIRKIEDGKIEYEVVNKKDVIMWFREVEKIKTNNGK